MGWQYDSDKTGPSGYQNLDSTYRDESSPPQSSSAQPRYSQVITILITSLCLAGLVATICLSLRPAPEPHMFEIVLPEQMESVPEFAPVIEHSSGGWSRLGHLPPPDTPDPKVDPEPSPSLMGQYGYAAVSVDSIPCAKIGKYVLIKLRRHFLIIFYLEM